jgi:hypothetical protein
VPQYAYRLHHLPTPTLLPTFTPSLELISSILPSQLFHLDPSSFVPSTTNHLFPTPDPLPSIFYPHQYFLTTLDLHQRRFQLRRLLSRTMAAQLTPLKAFKCTYDDCFHSFDTEREMNAHLKDKKLHPYYCGKDPGYQRIQRGFVKCDFHGKTWDELVAHKVETMLPWIVGERRFDKPKKLNHIVCEFCGEDFESLSGREIHRKQVCRVMKFRGLPY